MHCRQWWQTVYSKSGNTVIKYTDTPGSSRTVCHRWFTFSFLPWPHAPASEQQVKENPVCERERWFVCTKKCEFYPMLQYPTLFYSRIQICDIQCHTASSISRTSAWIFIHEQIVIKSQIRRRGSSHDALFTILFPDLISIRSAK